MASHAVLSEQPNLKAFEIPGKWVREVGGGCKDFFRGRGIHRDRKTDRERSGEVSGEVNRVNVVRLQDEPHCNAEGDSPRREVRKKPCPIVRTENQQPSTWVPETECRLGRS